MAYLKQDLQKLHETELEILLEFKRICEKYNLTYYLVAGTLLGAVRHKGFIPWDDDIDVAMPREDFERFCHICSRELKREYFLQTKQTDPEYFMEIAKIRKNGTHVCEPKVEHLDIHQGVYIDIFAMDKCPSNSFLVRSCFRVQYLLSTSIEVQKGIDTKYSGRNPLFRAVFWIFRKVNLSVLYKMQDRLFTLMNRFSGNEYCCTLAGRHGYPGEMYKKEWLEKTVDLEFEGEVFKAPAYWHEALSNMYGDYQKIPEIKEQHIVEYQVS